MAVFGRPLTPAEVDLIHELVVKHLGDADGVASKSAIRAAVADHFVRLMQLLHVPIEDLLRDHPLPETLDQAFKLALTPQHRREIEYAANNAATLVRGWTDDIKTHLVRTINQGVRARLGGRHLGQILTDQFADHNKDLVRIAETEIASAHNSGAIGGVKVGSYVLGQSFPNACAWCRRNIHGHVLKVVSPPRAGEDRDWEKEIWPGKSNYGRYQSPIERDTGRHREDWELWKPSVIGHPSCRCWYVRFVPSIHTVDDAGHIQIRSDVRARRGA
jgi:hypothetical protein